MFVLRKNRKQNQQILLESRRQLFLRLRQQNNNNFNEFNKKSQKTNQIFRFLSSPANVSGTVSDGSVSKEKTDFTLSKSVPKEARVVICGGGIMGSSVAYHLALHGWGPHTVIFDQGK